MLRLSSWLVAALEDQLDFGSMVRQAKLQNRQKRLGFLMLVAGVATPGALKALLARVFPLWPKVRLWALEPHDLALTKLERSNDRDMIGRGTAPGSAALRLVAVAGEEPWIA